MGYLRNLATIILENIDAIEELEKQQNVQFPTLNDPWDPSAPAHQFTLQANVREKALIASSAASQLVATLKPPARHLYERTGTVCAFVLFHSLCLLILLPVLYLVGDACLVRSLCWRYTACSRSKRCTYQ